MLYGFMIKDYIIEKIKQKIPILKVFDIINTDKTIFWTWFFVIMFFSNLGIILSYITNKNPNLIDIVIINQQQGNFYNISIALCASYLATIIINVISNRKEEKEEKYLIIKMVSVVFIIIFIVMMAILYTTTLFQNQNNIVASTKSIDFIQISIYIISIIVVIYLFCLTNLKNEDSNFIDLQDEKQKKIKKSAESASEDGRGIKL